MIMIIRRVTIMIKKVKIMMMLIRRVTIMMMMMVMHFGVKTA